MGTGLLLAAVAALALALACAGGALAMALSWGRGMRRELDALSPHARLLGRVVEARLYETSDWERCVVVAVSHGGGVCLRRESDPHARGRWVPKWLAPSRVREAA